MSKDSGGRSTPVRLVEYYDEASNLDQRAPASNTAAVITYAGIPDSSHVISGVSWSYDDDPTGGQLTITMNGVTVYIIDEPVKGPGFIPFLPNKRFNKGTTVVITLAAGGAGVTGKLNVLGHRIV